MFRQKYIRAGLGLLGLKNMYVCEWEGESHRHMPSQTKINQVITAQHNIQKNKLKTNLRPVWCFSDPWADCWCWKTGHRSAFGLWGELGLWRENLQIYFFEICPLEQILAGSISMCERVCVLEYIYIYTYNEMIYR